LLITIETILRQAGIGKQPFYSNPDAQAAGFRASNSIAAAPVGTGVGRAFITE